MLEVSDFLDGIPRSRVGVYFLRKGAATGYSKIVCQLVVLLSSHNQCHRDYYQTITSYCHSIYLLLSCGLCN